MADYFSDNYNDDAGSGSAESAESYNNPGPDSQTALLPMDFFGDKQIEPGHTCTVKVVKVLDDQVQVQYQAADEPDSDDMMS